MKPGPEAGEWDDDGIDNCIRGRPTATISPRADLDRPRLIAPNAFGGSAWTRPLRVVREY